jgi:hypothetical protein
MSDTTHLALPQLAASQAQKHVTVNEALALLDALVHLAVQSRTLATPPTTPAEGERYLVPAAATGLWAGRSGQIAVFLAGVWVFAVPREGWQLWVASENVALTYDGVAWIAGSVPTVLQNLQMVGVNATADATNKLSVSSSATLFNHAGAGHQIKLNKASAAQTASLLWQTAFSGRAELGTTGDDDFHFKVSENGTAWNEALLINRTTGQVSLPQGLALLPTFTSADKGVVPASGGGALKFLRADGAWSVPVSGGNAIPFKTGVGRWQTNSVDTTTLTTLAGAANRMDLAPWLCPHDVAVDQMGALCSTAVAASLGKICCYSSDVDGRPSTLLFETTTLDFGAVGFKQVAQVFGFQRGALYWLGLRHSSTATVNAHQTYCSPTLGFPAIPTTAASKVLRRTLTFATAAPATWGYAAAEETAANVPALFMRIA